MGAWTKGPEVANGKTKKLFATVEDPNLGVVKTGNNITAHDDPGFTKQFPAKPRLATQTNCNVFRLLQAAGLPVAFRKQLAEDEFLVPIVEMIPLEVIARRVADGSYLKRRPDYKRPGERLHQFHRLVTEFFLKTSGGQLVKGRRTLVSGLPMMPASGGKTKPLDDPFIINPEDDDAWRLFEPKKPSWEPGSDLEKSVTPRDVLFPIEAKISGDWTVRKIMDEIDRLNRWAFLVMEKAWGILGYKLGDWKLEFGWTMDGRLVIGDVIDNDSWRLRDRRNQEKSKQVFRDHGLTEQVEINYAEISAMSNHFFLPEHVIVLWRGSPNDSFPEVPEIPGITKVEVTNSGHKATNNTLSQVEELLRNYPCGGVIICTVGMSNGLGAILAAHTAWVVVGVPSTIKDFHEDVWSNLNMPSDVPMATIVSPKNAVIFAINVLAYNNPAAYAYRQQQIESFDPNY